MVGRPGGEPSVCRLHYQLLYVRVEQFTPEATLQTQRMSRNQEETELAPHAADALVHQYGSMANMDGGDRNKRRKGTRGVLGVTARMKYHKPTTKRRALKVVLPHQVVCTVSTENLQE